MLFLDGNTEQMLITSMFIKGEVAAPSMFLLFNCGGGLSTSIHLLEVDARRYRQKRFSNILLPASGRHSASSFLQVVGDLWERGVLMTSEPLEAHYDDS